MFTYGKGGTRGHYSVSRHKELELQYLFLGPVDLWLSKVDWVPSRDSWPIWVKQKLVETGRERERVMPKKLKQPLDAEEALRKVNQK
jgi:hypothetical protein